MTNADISPLEATLTRMIDAGELRYIETRNGIARYEIINTEPTALLGSAHDTEGTGNS